MAFMNHLYAVIMAGGSGTRFWPLSQPERPKQLLSLCGVSSLLNQTIERMTGVVDLDRIAIVTTEALREQVCAEAKTLRPERVLAEPEARNTAPCVAWAAAHLFREDPDAILLVVPSDHFIGQPQQYVEQMRLAAGFVQKAGFLTFGIKPTRPDTGFGYIHVGEVIERAHDLHRVQRFVEKPNLERAQAFVEQGGFLWNSGMFVFSAHAVLDAFRRYWPTSSAAIDAYLSATDVSEPEHVRRLYEALPNMSFDHAIVEKLDSVMVMPARFEWSDLGSWISAWELADKNELGNLERGNVVTVDVHNSYICNETSRPVAVVGLSNVAVVDTAQGLLVMPLERAQEIRKVVDALKAQSADPLLKEKT